MAQQSSGYPNIAQASRVPLPYYSADFTSADLYADDDRISYEDELKDLPEDSNGRANQHAALPQQYHEPGSQEEEPLTEDDDLLHAQLAINAEGADQKDVDFEPDEGGEPDDASHSPSPDLSPSKSARGSGRPRGRPRSKRGSARTRGGRQSTGQAKEQNPATPRRGRGRPRASARARAAGSPLVRSHAPEDMDDDDGDEDLRIGRPKGQARKRPDPSPEYHQAQVEANAAIFRQDYAAARLALERAININPEIFAAYISLSEILFTENKPSEAMTTLFAGGFTMKSDLSVWRHILESLQRHGALYTRDDYLGRLHACHTQISRLDPTDIESRHARISIHMERGQLAGAQSVARNLLRHSPLDLRALSVLADTARTDQFVLQEAVQAYQVAIAHFVDRSSESSEPQGFGWADLDHYTGLFVHLKEYETGLLEAKRLSRWLLGRADETYWDAWTQDDREFDEQDEPRRVQVPEFQRDEHIDDAHGLMLPPELRSKLGVLRLKRGDREEALMHFEFFEPESTADEPPSLAYPHASREIADALTECGESYHANRFFDAIFASKDFTRDDSARYRTYSQTLVKEQRINDAMEAYGRLIRKQPGAWQDRLDLARLYEERGLEGDDTRALLLVREVMRQHHPAEALSSGLRSASKLKGSRLSAKRAIDADAARRAGIFADKKMFEELGIDMDGDLANGSDYLEQMPVGRWGRGQKRYKRLEIDKKSSEASYNDLRQLTAELVDEDGDVAAWLDTAVELTRTFLDQHALSEGVLNLQSYKEERSGVFVEGVSFAEWLSIVCQTCMVLASYGDYGERKAAREYLMQAERVPEFFNKEDFLHQLHLCQVLYGALASDEDGMVYALRWWTSNYGHMSDIYAMASLMTRFCGKPPELGRRGPHLKYWLRHVKAQDYALMDDDQRRIYDFKGNERRAFSKYPDRLKRGPDETGHVLDADPAGNPQGLQSADPSLLTFYGDTMTGSGSFSNALNYYMRAYHARPEDPLVLLSIASAYMQLSLKRTTENRQWAILTGIGMFQSYAKARRQQAQQQSSAWLRAQREMEIEFNEGRILHSLGLAHHAYGAYERCLAVDQVPFGAEEEAAGLMKESDYKIEAALALQHILLVAGNVEGAKEIAERWLVF